MTAIVIGASAGLGRALSAALAETGRDLILVASDIRDLQPLCTQLKLNHNVNARAIEVDASDIDALQEALQSAISAGPPPTSIYLPIGLSREDDGIATELAQSSTVWTVNFLSVVAAIQTTLPHLLRGEDARIVGFGSIATIRGRGRNVTYAAAKRALSSYFESLRHDLSDQEVAVQFYQMGYIETQQLFGQASLLPAISPERAADRIVRDRSRDFGSRFLPRYWMIIAPVLRNLPWAVFRKLKF